MSKRLLVNSQHYSFLTAKFKTCMSILNRLFLDFEPELFSLLLTPLSLFFISLSFLAALGLCGCAWVFSSCDEQGLLSSCDAQASHCSGSSWQSTGSGHSGFSRCSLRVELPHSVWNMPGPGIEPTSPALAGGIATTGPLRKSSLFLCFVLPLSYRKFSLTDCKILCFPWSHSFP